MCANELKIFLEYLDSLKALESQIKELQDEADAIKDLIKESMSVSGDEEILVGDYKVTYREVVSNRFDSTTFKKAYSELYKQYTKTTTYRRLTVN